MRFDLIIKSPCETPEGGNSTTTTGSDSTTTTSSDSTTTTST